MLDNGLMQISVPQSKEHAEAQWKAERDLGINLYDVCMIDLVEKSEEYVKKVKVLAKGSDIVIFSHPYLYGLRKYLGREKLVVYEAHNVEYLLKKDYVKGSDYAQKVRDIEQESCLSSDLIFATSEEEGKTLAELYGILQEKIVVVPNGVDTSSLCFLNREDSRDQKKQIGISEPTILFVGSWHPPNLEALSFITNDLARKLPEYLFLIVGSIKDYYLQKYKKFPKNVMAFGVVDEVEKVELYKLADLAINPMFSGSGTNLKMLDYMSAGIPVISTPVGARGLEIENYKHAIVCPPEQFAAKISELISKEQLQDDLRINARRLVEDKYSWKSISKIAQDSLLVA